MVPADAARLLSERFAQPLLLGPEVGGRLPDVLSQPGMSGGAGFDGRAAGSWALWRARS